MASDAGRLGNGQRLCDRGPRLVRARTGRVEPRAQREGLRERTALAGGRRELDRLGQLAPGLRPQSQPHGAVGGHHEGHHLRGHGSRVAQRRDHPQRVAPARGRAPRWGSGRSSPSAAIARPASADRPPRPAAPARPAAPRPAAPARAGCATRPACRARARGSPDRRRPQAAPTRARRAPEPRRQSPMTIAASVASASAPAPTTGSTPASTARSARRSGWRGGRRRPRARRGRAGAPPASAAPARARSTPASPRQRPRPAPPPSTSAARPPSSSRRSRASSSGLSRAARSSAPPRSRARAEPRPPPPGARARRPRRSDRRRQPPAARPPRSRTQTRRPAPRARAAGGGRRLVIGHRGDERMPELDLVLGDRHLPAASISSTASPLTPSAASARTTGTRSLEPAAATASSAVRAAVTGLGSRPATPPDAAARQRRPGQRHAPGMLVGAQPVHRAPPAPSGLPAAAAASCASHIPSSPGARSASSAAAPGLVERRQRERGHAGRRLVADLSSTATPWRRPPREVLDALARLRVEPVQIVDEHQQGVVGQADETVRGRAHGEAVAGRRRRQGQRAGERIALRRRQVREAAEQRPDHVSEAGERQLGLAFDPARRRHDEPVRPAARLRQQRGLAGARLADQGHRTARGANLREQRSQRRQLRVAPDEHGVASLTANANDQGIPLVRSWHAAEILGSGHSRPSKSARAAH